MEDTSTPKRSKNGRTPGKVTQAPISVRLDLSVKERLNKFAEAEKVMNGRAINMLLDRALRLKGYK